MRACRLEGLLCSAEQLGGDQAAAHPALDPSGLQHAGPGEGTCLSQAGLSSAQGGSASLSPKKGFLRVLGPLGCLSAGSRLGRGRRLLAGRRGLAWCPAVLLFALERSAT